MPTWDDIPDASADATEANWDAIPDLGTALDATYRQARTQSVGDKFSQTLLLADRTKWPSPLVERMQDKAGVVAERPDFAKLTKDAPHLAWAMTDRDFMRLAYDDGESLSVLEKTLKAPAHGALMAAGTTLGGIGLEIESALGPAGAYGARLGKALYDLFPSKTAAALPEVPHVARQILDPGVGLAEGFQLTGKGVDWVASLAEIPEDERTWYTDLGEAVGQMGFQAGMSMVNPAAAMVGFQGMGYKIGYDRALAATGDVETAKAAGTLSAAVEGITEKVGIDALMRVVPPAVRQGMFRYLADLVTTFGIETSQELLANWGQNAIDRFVIGEDGKPIFSMPGSEEISAGGAAAILRSLVIGMSRGRATMTLDEQIEDRRKFFEDVQNATTNSKLFGRHKDTFTEYAQGVLEDSENATAYIESKGLSIYLESLPEAQREELIGFLGGRQKVVEALDFGQDLTLPLAEFLKLADTDHYTALTADTRLRAEDLTVRELEEAKTKLGAKADEILAEQDNEAELQESADMVAEEVQRQLEATGQLPAMAQTNAALHRANAIVLAHELGITPAEVYEKFGLKITGQIAEGMAGQEYDQTGKLITDNENFRNWFGDSKVVDEAGEPLVAHHGGLGISTAEYFDPAYGGMNTGHNEHGAFHFVDNQEVADDYGRQSFIRRYQDDPEALVDDGVITQEQLDDWQERDEVYGEVEQLAEERIERQDVYLHMENPYVLDMKGERVDVQQIEDLSRAFMAASRGDFSGISGDALDALLEMEYFNPSDVAAYKDEIEAHAIDQNDLSSAEEIEDWQFEEATREVLEENGVEPQYPSFDGIIIRNMVDDIGDYSNQVADQYIVFDPTQIKSVFNRGTFDPQDPRILYQEKQDFGGLKLEEEVTIAETGETVTVAQDAQRVWEQTQKRLNMVEMLKGCLDAN